MVCISFCMPRTPHFPFVGVPPPFVSGLDYILPRFLHPLVLLSWFLLGSPIPSIDYLFSFPSKSESFGTYDYTVIFCILSHAESRPRVLSVQLAFPVACFDSDL